MRILITLDFPPQAGGIQQYLYGIVRHTYCSSDLVITTGRADLQSDMMLPCRVIRIPPVFSFLNVKAALPAMALEVMKQIRSHGPGEISLECGNVYAALIPYMLFRPHPLPYIVYAYGSELIRLSRSDLWAALVRKAACKASGIITLGQYTSSLLDKAGIPAKPLVVPPKIELASEQMKGVVRQQRAPVPDVPVNILSVGRLVEHKGHHVLLHALASVKQKFNFHLVIAGRGPCETVLHRIAEEQGIADRVEILSGLTNVEIGNCYDTADLFILPSIETPNGAEGFGIVMLEAMAHGVPVIASRSGGIPEVLDNGKCGKLVPPGDAAALAEAVLNLWNDHAGRTQAAEQAAVRLREHYVW